MVAENSVLLAVVLISMRGRTRYLVKLLLQFAAYRRLMLNGGYPEMATHRISLLGRATLPDTTGSVFFEPSSVKDANDLYRRTVVVFDDVGAKIGLSGRVQVPQNYAGSPVAIVVWKSAATSGAVVWDIDYTAVGNGESLDPPSHQQMHSATANTNATARTRQETTIALGVDFLAAGKDLLVTVSRDGAVGADTMSGAAIVEGLYLQYSDE